MHSVEIVRMLDASPPVVWAAWTEAAVLEAWFWPHLDNRVTIDLRISGGFEIESVVPVVAASGRYRTIDAPKRLVFTWQWRNEITESRVEVDLTSEANKTILRLRHSELLDASTRDRHHDGWWDCLERLVGLIDRERG